jgi:hypothetical protein
VTNPTLPSLEVKQRFPHACAHCTDRFVTTALLETHQRTICGPAMTSGVIATLYAIKRAMASGDRADAKVFHSYEPGSVHERAFDDGCQWAATRTLGGAEFALRVRGEREMRRERAGGQN